MTGRTSTASWTIANVSPQTAAMPMSASSARLAIWAQAQQRALLAARRARRADAAAVAQHVRVYLVGVLAVLGQHRQRVVGVLELRLLGPQAQSPAHTEDMGIDRHVGQAVGEQKDAGRGLAADAGE